MIKTINSPEAKASWCAKYLQKGKNASPPVASKLKALLNDKGVSAINGCYENGKNNDSYNR